MAGVGASGVADWALTSSGVAARVVADPGNAVAGAGVACAFSAAPPVGVYLFEDDGVTVLFEDDGITALTED